MIMPPLDIAILINWITSGFIGLVFGIASAWITHRYEIKRDFEAWKREKEKLQLEFQHDREMFEAQMAQKILELEKQYAQQQSERIRGNLLKGVENSAEAIKRADEMQRMFRPQTQACNISLPDTYVAEMERLQRWETNLKQFLKISLLFLVAIALMWIGATVMNNSSIFACIIPVVLFAIACAVFFWLLILFIKKRTNPYS